MASACFYFQTKHSQQSQLKILCYTAEYSIQYNILLYTTIQYNTILYTTIQYKTIQYNEMQYNAIQCNAMQYNTKTHYTMPWRSIQQQFTPYHTILYQSSERIPTESLRVLQSAKYSSLFQLVKLAEKFLFISCIVRRIRTTRTQRKNS